MSDVFFCLECGAELPADELKRLTLFSKTGHVKCPNPECETPHKVLIGQNQGRFFVRGVRRVEKKKG